MAETAWCVTCRTYREVMDTYTTGPLGAEYIARPLECGHDAGDGGQEPRRTRPVTTPGLVERVAALQRGES